MNDTQSRCSTPEHDHPPGADDAALAAPRCGDVRDPGSGLPCVLTTKCGTCIFRCGNRMHLAPGCRDHLVHEALARGSWIVCHDTLPDTGNPFGTQAVCLWGFWDLHARESWGCRLAIVLGGPIFTSPTGSREPRR